MLHSDGTYVYHRICQSPGSILKTEEKKVFKKDLLYPFSLVQWKIQLSRTAKRVQGAPLIKKEGFVSYLYLIIISNLLAGSPGTGHQTSVPPIILYMMA